MMLSKHGWGEKSLALGKNEQGITEPFSASSTTRSQGLGYMNPGASFRTHIFEEASSTNRKNSNNVVAESSPSISDAHQKQLAELTHENKVLNDQVKELYELLVSQGEEAMVREREHLEYMQTMEKKVRDVMILNHHLRISQPLVATSISNEIPFCASSVSGNSDSIGQSQMYSMQLDGKADVSNNCSRESVDS